MPRFYHCVTLVICFFFAGPATPSETIYLLRYALEDDASKPYRGIDPHVPDSGDLRLCLLGQPAYRLDDLTRLRSIDERPDKRLARLMFDPLLERVPMRRAMFRPLIEESVTRAANGTTVRFKIDERATFSDGSPISGRDVIESLALAASRNQVLAALLNNMEFRDETNSGLVYVELHSPDLWDDLIVAFSEVPIVPAATRALIEADPAAHIPAGIVVSGAYGVENHNPDRTLSLVRRDEYWARTVPLRAGSDNFVSLHFEYYRDGAARQQAMLAGGCDLYFDDSEVSQQRFKRSLPEQAEDKIAFLRALTTPVETVDALVFNTRAGALRDAKLRHALQVAVARRSPDLDGIFTANMLGTETVLDLIQQAAGADAKARWEAHKAAERKEPGEILREGGYRLTDGRLLAPSGQQVAITLVLPSWAHRMAFGDLFEELGVETRVEVLEPGDYWPAMRERAFDAAFFRYPPLSRYPTPEFLRLVYSPDGAYNLPLIEMAGAEALISMASQARTESEFVNVLSALDLLAMLEHPFVLFPAHAKDRVTARSNLNMPGDRDLPRWHELDFRFWWRNDT